MPRRPAASQATAPEAPRPRREFVSPTELGRTLQLVADQRGWLQLMREKKMSARQLSERSGRSESFVKHIIRGKSLSPHFSHLQALANALTVPVELLVRCLPGGEGSDMGSQSRIEVPGIRLSVFAAHPQRDDGAFNLNMTQLTTVLAPRILRTWPGAYAFYAPDETMAPRWNKSELVLVQPDRPVGNGDYAMVEVGENQQGKLYLFRQMLRMEGTTMVLAAHAPGIENVRVKGAAIRVVDWAELLRD